jgi:hypothetical protein
MMPSTEQPRLLPDPEMLAEGKTILQDEPKRLESKEHADTSSSGNPINEVRALERWNSSSINIYRYVTTLFTFIFMGMNYSAYGVSSVLSP